MTKLLIRLFIKDHNNINNPLVRENYGRLCGFTGIACNFILFILKLLAGIYSGAVSIIADAFNNFSDMGSSIITLLGFKLANKPADKGHPFGHGRMEYLSAATVSVLIILAGIELLKGSINKIRHPEQITANYITLAILLVSIFIKLWMALFNRKLGGIISSKMLLATATDSIFDSVSTAVVFVSVLVSIVSNVNIDPYCGIFVSVLIIFAGLKSVKETIDPLLGTPPEPELIASILKIISDFDNFVGTHDLIVHNYGPGRIFASIHVEVPSDIDIIKCHEEIDLCEKMIYENCNVQTVIHMDPIVTDDTYINETKQKLVEKINEFDPALTIHDFRVVSGEKKTNLIFDIVIPQKYKLSNDQIVEKINCLAKTIDPTFDCVITIDVDYNCINSTN
ncbi:MAG: cation diffusion facilitator family transporter [bacterium]|nr:cation diffusion facilitator family transporter [bacterium]